jgi:hypothetical protein
VEQWVNLSARYASLLHKDQKSAAKAKSEAKESAKDSEWSPLKLLDSAQQRMEHLLHLAPSAQRYALLASCYKRRALVNDTDEAREARQDALTKCAEYYEKAYDISKDSDTPYSGLNWINCQVLLGIRDGDQRAKLREAFDKSLVNDPSKTTQDFWGRVKEGDIELSRLLFDEIEEAIEKLQHLYQQALGVGGTTREHLTVIENLEFVIDMLRWRSKEELADRLQAVHDGLKV